jgi:hypothetical protein
MGGKDRTEIFGDLVYGIEILNIDIYKVCPE